LSANIESISFLVVGNYEHHILPEWKEARREKIEITCANSMPASYKYEHI